MIHIKTFVFNPFQENTLVLYSDSGSATVIDPGCYENHEKQQLVSFIEENELHVEQLVNTHCHIDHVLGNDFIKEKYKVDLTIHETELEVLRSVKNYAPVYGFPQYRDTEPDRYFNLDEKLKIGDESMDILFVPGHSPGHVAFYNESQKICIGGDVLFRNSIGRTDLPGGNFDVLISSIRNTMFSLDPDTTVYPGHGETTTIGFEMKTNPFCAVI